MNRDRYDLPLTTVSDSAAAFYRDGVDRILSAWYGAGEAFDRAIAEDPAFALAHIARARIHQMNMEVTEARAKTAHARQLAAPASERERAMHWYSRSCSVLSACMHSPDAPIMMPQDWRFANATPGITARIGGS